MYRTDRPNPHGRASVFHPYLNRRRRMNHHAHTHLYRPWPYINKKRCAPPRKSRGAMPVLLPLGELCFFLSENTLRSLSSPLSSENRPPPHLPARIVGTLSEPSPSSPDAIASSSRHGHLGCGGVSSCCHRRRHRRCRCFR